MKVLQIIQRPQLRGAEVFACQLSTELNKAGVVTDVAILFGNNNRALEFPLHFLLVGADESKRFHDFKGYKSLAAIIEKGNYDIIQANAGDTIKYAAISKLLHGWKQPLVFRNANKISDFMTSAPKRLLNGFFIKQTAFIASVSEECRKDFVKTFHYPPDRTATLTIGVNLKTPPPYEEIEKVGVSGSPVYLSVAGFVPEKNHAGLLRIFATLRKTQPGAQLILIGTGKLEAAMAQLAADMDISHAVHFLGRRQDVLQIMPCCDALLMPSLIEGLPGVILEAFLTELPVVAYQVGGIGEVIKDRETGLLVEKNDEAGFIKKALLITGSSDLKNNITRNARQLITDQFNNTAIAAGFIKVYERLCAAR